MAYDDPSSNWMCPQWLCPQWAPLVPWKEQQSQWKQRGGCSTVNSGSPISGL
jgi:hypothetical protein